MSAYQNMKIHILRHGQRSAGYGDVPLSQEGLQQAQHLAQNSSLQDVNLILCSPKIRTQQTVLPLSERLQVPVQIASELDQRRSIETENEFIQRVMTFLQECTHVHANKTLLLCSHSDWLQMAIMNLPLPTEKAVAQCFFSCADFRTLLYTNRSWDLV
jgi:broad specificity phosphatase PhoE